MSAQYNIIVSFSLRSPFLSTQPGARALGIDASNWIVKHPTDETTVNIRLPGSMVRGNIRHALYYFHDVLSRSSTHSNLTLAQLNQWFGRASGMDRDSDDFTNPIETNALPSLDNNSETADIALIQALYREDNFQAHHATLHFPDYWESEDLNREEGQNNPSKTLRHRIALTHNGSVKEGALQFADIGVPTGEQVKFTGELHLLASEADVKLCVMWLKKALQFIPALGGQRGIGFGQLTLNDVTYQAKQPSASATPIPTEQQRFTLTIRPQSSFCIAKPSKPDSNNTHTETHIPGTVLRGLLAKHLRQLGRYGENLSDIDFDHWRVTHGYPCEDAANTDKPLQRPLPRPKSIAKLGDDLVDVAGLDLAPPLFTDLHKLEGRQLSFAIDWKGSDVETAHNTAALTRYQQADCSRELRIFNRISAEWKRGTTANVRAGSVAEGFLYSQERVKVDGLVWIAEIDLSAIATTNARQQALAALQQLFPESSTTKGVNYHQGQLFGMGKSKTTCQVTLAPTTDAPSSIAPPQNNNALLVIMLSSDALLLNNSFSVSGNSSNHAALHDAYQAYWKHLLPDGISLRQFYASQQLVGGHYFFSQQKNTQGYQPLCLTDAGSCFVFSLDNIQDSKALNDELQSLQRLGLPLPSEHQADTWQNNPWIRENGFGEIHYRYIPQGKLMMLSDQQSQGDA